MIFFQLLQNDCDDLKIKFKKLETLSVVECDVIEGFQMVSNNYKFELVYENLILKFNYGRLSRDIRTLIQHVQYYVMTSQDLMTSNAEFNKNYNLLENWLNKVESSNKTELSTNNRLAIEVSHQYL